MLMAPATVRGDGSLEIFDAHLHYNWEPTPHFTLARVLRLFEQENVTGILANSRPNDGTRALVAARPEKTRVVPFIRPYRVRSDVQTWFEDASILELIESEFKRGYYVGIGEFHLQGKEAESDVVRRTVEFARRHRLVLHAHTDMSALEILYRHDPEARIIWAHAGFSLPAAMVGQLLDKYPQLWPELSYRIGIVDAAGRLSPEWRQLFERYPERFLLGSDTWVNERWDSYGETMGAYRAWLKQLPPEVARKIASGNAAKLFPP
jgi:hypothetical protein